MMGEMLPLLALLVMFIIWSSVVKGYMKTINQRGYDIKTGCRGCRKKIQRPVSPLTLHNNFHRPGLLRIGTLK